MNALHTRAVVILILGEGWGFHSWRSPCMLQLFDAAYFPEAAS